MSEIAVPEAPAVEKAPITWNSHEAIVASIEQYKEQYVGVQAEVARLTKVMDNIAGAIGALEQLLDNERNELKPNAG